MVHDPWTHAPICQPSSQVVDTHCCCSWGISLRRYCNSSKHCRHQQALLPPASSVIECHSSCCCKLPDITRYKNAITAREQESSTSVKSCLDRRPYIEQPYSDHYSRTKYCIRVNVAVYAFCLYYYCTYLTCGSSTGRPNQVKIAPGQQD